MRITASSTFWIKKNNFMRKVHSFTKYSAERKNLETKNSVKRGAKSNQEEGNNKP